MTRAIILDNLTEQELKTKPCINETDAKIEGNKAIERLCKKCRIAVTDGRFVISCTEQI